MEQLYLTKDTSQTFKDVDTTKRTVTGYFAAFNIKDSDEDIIQKGAFAKTIAERGPSGSKAIRYLQDHDRYKTVGTLNDLKEDDYGLYYEGRIGRHTVGNDFLMMVEDGIIKEHSFGYRVIKQQRKSDANYLQEIFMYEGSGLQVPAANPFTPITGIKSESDLLTLFDTLEKALKNGKYSDECFTNTIIPRYEAIKSILPQTSTEPPAGRLDDDELKSILKNFKF